MYRCLMLIRSLVGIAHASGVSAEPLRIMVIDENNKGVFSRVYYSDGTHRHSFFVTDHEGKVQQAPSECGKISTLRARPYDRKRILTQLRNRACQNFPAGSAQSNALWQGNQSTNDFIFVARWVRRRVDNKGCFEINFPRFGRPSK
jgi:hypothetical protein